MNTILGMSECTGATTFSTDEAHLWGSCGWQLAGTEVRIFKHDTNNEVPRAPAFDGSNIEEKYQGEVCYRGRHIMMGYMANADLGEDFTHLETITRKLEGAIDGCGWLHSGDKGALDSRGGYM